MKNKAFLLFFCLLGSYLASFAQDNRLTVHLNQASLGQVFDLIQNQSEYIIFFKDNQVNLSTKVSVNADNQTIEVIFDQILAGTNLNYKVFDRQIIIVKDKEIPAEYGQLGKGPIKKKTVIGKVADENGNPIPGVSIIVKGTTIGIISSYDGTYRLEVPEASLYLCFSYIGYKKIDELLKDKTEINVVLTPENFGVDEVIVSALGLKRSEKALTYATQNISANEISKNQGFNFVSGLSGKISGIEITKSAAGAGGSTKVVLRGNKSLSASSEPLFVIDGIPMANNKGGQLGIFGGADQGDGLSQISTDDIESMSILKGANASALYGSQGANGVILITTKKGKEGPIKATLSSIFTIEKIQDTPDLQFEYGSVNNAKESWSTSKGKYSSNFIKNFFNPGTARINTVTISGGGTNTTAYFLFSNTAMGGVITGNNYQKTNITFKQSTKLFNEHLTVSSNVMLTEELIKNKNTAGYYLNPLIGLYLFPRDRDFASYARDYQVFSTTRNMYLQNWFVKDHFQSNPNWIINNQKKEDLNKRVIANMLVEWKINDHLNFQMRSNIDHSERTYEQKNKAGSNETNVHANGSWSYQRTTDELIYADAILSYRKTLNDFSLDAVLGTSYLKSKYGLGMSVNTGTYGLIYPNEFSFQNIETNVMVNSILGSTLIKEAVFGNAQLGYKEKVFLDVSGRNDWASSLYGTGNDSYFYPCVGITALVSEIFKLPEFISFGKVRSSYSIVANEVPFNSVSPNNSISSSGGIDRNTTKPFNNLKPELIRSFEIGTDWKLFKGRFGFNLTYYNINSHDQFISLPAPSGSGYSRYFVNAGKLVNSGIELTLSSEQIDTKNFNWSTDINFSGNKNKIITLHPDLKNPIILSDNDGYQLLIKEGGSFGDIYVHKFLRDDQGRIKLDEKGNILKTEQKEYIGNSNPRWSLGLNNNFRYKNMTFGFLINSKVGGMVVSQTEAMLDGYGVSQRSAIARDNGGVIINAVMPDGTAVNKIDAKQYFTTIGDRDGIKEPYTYHRTNIRLAQASISYEWNFQNAVVKQATFSLIGSNLFFFYKDAPFDPEVTLNTQMIDQAIENFSLPSTRTFGFDFKLSF
jgi:TonB-linked SusC/RagA family outer membrane protein